MQKTPRSRSEIAWCPPSLESPTYQVEKIHVGDRAHPLVLGERQYHQQVSDDRQQEDGGVQRDDKLVLKGAVTAALSSTGATGRLGRLRAGRTDHQRTPAGRVVVRVDDERAVLAEDVAERNRQVAGVCVPGVVLLVVSRQRMGGARVEQQVVLAGGGRTGHWRLTQLDAVHERIVASQPTGSLMMQLATRERSHGNSRRDVRTGFLARVHENGRLSLVAFRKRCVTSRVQPTPADDETELNRDSPLTAAAAAGCHAGGKANHDWQDIIFE
uniref:Uncharacterized protein n=1 Tax=Anopheles atroparvus TaxID=41427 RepID=A0A182J7Z5_ANOAO